MLKTKTHSTRGLCQKTRSSLHSSLEACLTWNAKHPGGSSGHWLPHHPGSRGKSVTNSTYLEITDLHQYSSTCDSCNLKVKYKYGKVCKRKYSLSVRIKYNIIIYYYIINIYIQLYLHCLHHITNNFKTMCSAITLKCFMKLIPQLFSSQWSTPHGHARNSGKIVYNFSSK